MLTEFDVHAGSLTFDESAILELSDVECLIFISPAEVVDLIEARKCTIIRWMESTR